MIDRAKRDQLAQALRQLASGRLSNFSFESLTDWKSADDPGVFAVFYELGYFLYGDECEYCLRGTRALSQDVRRECARAVVFLHSDCKYEWPGLAPEPPGLTSTGLLFGLGLGCALLAAVDGLAFCLLPGAAIVLFAVALPYRQRRAKARLAEWKRAGDYEVWPFFRKTDFAVAQRRPRLLAGKRR